MTQLEKAHEVRGLRANRDCCQSAPEIFGRGTPTASAEADAEVRLK